MGLRVTLIDLDKQCLALANALDWQGSRVHRLKVSMFHQENYL